MARCRRIAFSLTLVRNTVVIPSTTSPRSRNDPHGSPLLRPLRLYPIHIRRRVRFPTLGTRETLPLPNLHSLPRIPLPRHGTRPQFRTPLPPAIRTRRRRLLLQNRSHLLQRRILPLEFTDTTNRPSFHASRIYRTFIRSRRKCLRWLSEANGSSYFPLYISLSMPSLVAFTFKIRRCSHALSSYILLHCTPATTRISFGLQIPSHCITFTSNTAICILLSLLMNALHIRFSFGC